MKNSSVIKNNIYNEVSKSIIHRITNYKKYINEFISNRYEDLYDIAPCRRIFFTNDDSVKFFKAINIDPKIISDNLKNTYYANQPNFNPAAAKDETTVTMLCIVRFFLQNKNKYKKELDMALINYAFSGKMYPSIHYGFFKTVQPIEYRYVMDYVVNNMLSNKFILKSSGNIIESIRSICNTWISTYKNRFDSFDDEDCVYLIQQLHGRIKSFMKNIASLYYEAYENKSQFINYTTDDFSEDNYRMSNNDITISENYVNNAMTKLMNESINYKYCQMASSKIIKTDEVKTIIEWIIKNDDKSLNKVKELVSLLVFNFTSNNKNKSVQNIEFIIYSVTPKPNSKDKNYLKQKEIIETWLENGSNSFRRRRVSINVKNAFVKAVTMYFTLIIHYANI